MTENIEALKRHGYQFYSESDDESDSGKSQFDAEYYNAKPPTCQIDYSKVVVIKTPSDNGNDILRSNDVHFLHSSNNLETQHKTKVQHIKTHRPLENDIHRSSVNNSNVPRTIQTLSVQDEIPWMNASDDKTSHQRIHHGTQEVRLQNPQPENSTKPSSPKNKQNVQSISEHSKIYEAGKQVNLNKVKPSNVARPNQWSYGKTGTSSNDYRQRSNPFSPATSSGRFNSFSPATSSGKSNESSGIKNQPKVHTTQKQVNLSNNYAKPVAPAPSNPTFNQTIRTDTRQNITNVRHNSQSSDVDLRNPDSQSCWLCVLTCITCGCCCT